MKGLATGNRADKPLRREQTIYTPQSVLDVVRAVWPEGIALDPCGGPDGLVEAEAILTGVQIETGRIGKNGPIMAWDGGGLSAVWEDRTYVNPPYEVLGDWLVKSAYEWGTNNVREQILLFPVRPNRVWWVNYMRKIPNDVAWLKPLPFYGQKQAFPAPLVLVYTGLNREVFRKAVAPLSTFVGGRLV